MAPNYKKKIAVFDIDGTIFRSSLVIELLQELIREKLFKSQVETLFRKEYENWLNREGTYEAYIGAVVGAFQENLKGIAYNDVRRVAYKVVIKHKNRTYRYTRDLVKKLKSKNYYILAISHSPKLAVEGFCKTLGFNKVYALMYEVDKNGKFTSNILYPDLIFRKDKILKRALGDEGLTLKNSVGVGDTDSDIAFLKIVDHPICFNPNKKLYTYAKKKKWKVVVERKDVIYDN